MKKYKVRLKKEHEYFVLANSHDEAVDIAIQNDIDGADWNRKPYYDEIESEEMDNGTV